MSTRSVPAFLAAVGLAAAAVFVGAAPAAAHDQLVGSDPGANTTVEAVPEQIVLTFSAEVLADDGATVVEVTDATGTLVSEGAPVVEGVDVTQSITAGADPNGDYEVVWKVVSSDGHPIDGAFVFTVEGVEVTPSPTPTAEEPATATPIPTETTPAAVPPTQVPGIPGFVWIIIGIVTVAVLGAVIYLLVARTRGAGATGGDRPGD